MAEGGQEVKRLSPEDKAAIHRELVALDKKRRGSGPKMLARRTARDRARVAKLREVRARIKREAKERAR